MKIAIEAQRIFRQNKHGMDFVALEVIRELQKIDKENEYYILVAPGEDHCLQETANFHIVEIRWPSYPLWEQVGLPRYVLRLKPDILHCTSNTAPLFCSVPLVLTLHDIIYLEPRASKNASLYQNMGWYYRKYVVPRILGKCRKIITVSDFECQRIKQKLHLPDSVITAIHNGYSSHFHQIEDFKDVVAKYIDSEKYIFFLGNTDPKKNVPRTIKAYSVYLSRSAEKLPLLIADLKDADLQNILKAQNLESIKDKIKLTGYVKNTDLAYLYNGAEMFLYTSLRESFGIPLIEAMACGTPVITSNTSSLPEVGGAGALMVDPEDENAIAGAMLHLEQDKTYYQQQVEYSLQRAKCFSWQNTAKAVLNIYNEVNLEKR